MPRLQARTPDEERPAGVRARLGDLDVSAAILYALSRHAHTQAPSHPRHRGCTLKRNGIADGEQVPGHGR